MMWGSAHGIRQLATKLDDIACRVRPDIAITAPLPCTAAQFFSRLDQAMDDVPDRTPGQNLADRLPNADGSITYVHTNGTRVTFNKKGFPEFEPHHLWPDPAQAQQWVEFRCDRDWERLEANRRSGIPGGAPDTHQWHHSHKFRNRAGTVEILMQLVRVDVHRWAQHTGGFGIGKAVLRPGVCRE